MPGGVWVGYWNDDKPTPGDLARTQQIDGHYVPTDAGEWLVPLARQFQPIDGGVFGDLGMEIDATAW